MALHAYSWSHTHCTFEGNQIRRYIWSLWNSNFRELKHQTFLVPRTQTRRIFAAWQPLGMSRRSWVVVTDFKTQVLRLKAEVQILGSSKSVRHTKVEILRLKSCFLHKKETKLSRKINLWKTFFVVVGVRDCFTLICLMICIWRVNRVPDPVLRDQPCHSWFNQERLVLKFPFVSLEPQCLPECLPLSHQVFDLETMRGKCRTSCLPKPSLKIIHGTPI